MRLIFAGTPEPAVPALRALIEHEGHEVVAVLTRPDARVGRGRSLKPSPVKAVALEHGIEVIDPVSLSDADARARLAELAPDCIPVVAYGNLVPKDLLDVPAHGWVNLHFSLLPAWRGAAPVQAAIAAGDEITGASTFLIEEGLDTGPVFGTVTEAIKPTDTADDLLGRLAQSGAALLAATMDGLEAGRLRPEAQSADGVSHAPKIVSDDARVDWSMPGHLIDRRIRAHTPAPGAWTMLGDDRLKLGPVTPVAGDDDALDQAPLEPGRIRVEKKRVLVGAGGGTAVALGDVQPPGKRMMNAVDWARGARPDDGKLV
ncbi:methionyl-tRNA formyltransferase [Corynebacterium xerosis]|uniref:methionyl-tRNA formyltransferase n=1 Tax=Corynebacterium xerosis TaxID=1725 RepID=UPI0006279285|nr:methionyl-tRNA formyltransferase [Corynebacterium xerosis]KKO81561.1 methionyl-tRNA formyltransferase [Corynebacterium xerosis]SQB95119.1 methionyl-tRNA formyltransferase [Clostridium paraputrificum]HJG58295.1 methionyl-tRNA formyltransferase [Corynebacterium xerosis]